MMSPIHQTFQQCIKLSFDHCYSHINFIEILIVQKILIKYIILLYYIIASAKVYYYVMLYTITSLW